MHHSSIDVLQRQFPCFTRNDIRQEVLLAELRGGSSGLAFIVAQRRLIDRVRRETAFYSRFISYDAPIVGYRNRTYGYAGEDPAHLILAADDPMMAAFIEEQEWQDLLSRLPYPARKLAEFAKYEAERFEDVPDGIWTRENVTELRRRVKRDWIAWDRDHSERAYLRTKKVLVGVLRRHRKVKERGGGG